MEERRAKEVEPGRTGREVSRAKKGSDQMCRVFCQQDEIDMFVAGTANAGNNNFAV